MHKTITHSVTGRSKKDSCRVKAFVFAARALVIASIITLGTRNILTSFSSDVDYNIELVMSVDIEQHSRKNPSSPSSSNLTSIKYRYVMNEKPMTEQNPLQDESLPSNSTAVVNSEKTGAKEQPKIHKQPEQEENPLLTSEATKEKGKTDNDVNQGINVSSSFPEAKEQTKMDKQPEQEENPLLTSEATEEKGKIDHAIHQGTNVSSSFLNSTISEGEKDKLVSMIERKEQEVNPQEKRNGDVMWFRPYMEHLVKAWEPRDTSWCVPQETNKVNIVLEKGDHPNGLLYIKSYKASSSTCTGVALRIANNLAKRKFGNESMPCKAYTDHPFADAKSFGLREFKKSLLFSFVRFPHKRDLSQIFHMDIGRNQLIAANDSEAIIQRLDELKGTQTNYLLPGFLQVNRNKTDYRDKWPRPSIRRNTVVEDKVIKKMTNRLFGFYDFLGVTERMEDSLAVMVLLFGLDPSDVVVLSSKTSGGYDDAGGKTGECTLIPKAVTTPEIDDYLHSQHRVENIDYLLYNAAVKSLNRTIKALGAERVQKMVETIRQLQQTAEGKCREEAMFPCSPTGEAQLWASQESCYHLDSGCGYKCIDRVLSSSDVTAQA